MFDFLRNIFKKSDGAEYEADCCRECREDDCYDPCRDRAVELIDIESGKQKIRDFIDSPKMDELKATGRTVRDFLGFVPNYAQSIPGMVRDGVEKLKNKH